MPENNISENININSDTILEKAVNKLKDAYFSELISNIFDFYSFTGYKKEIDKKPILDSFEKFILKYYTDRFFYFPESMGFSLFIMIPPYLSAPEYREIFGVPFLNPENKEQEYFKSYVYAIPFLAREFSPPPRTAKIEENKLINGNIPYIDEITPGNQMNVTYFETRDLMVYTFHSIWFRYIEDVKSGNIKPDDEIIKNGILDYVASAFILKFTNDLELQYLGYAVGMIPTEINPSDIVKSQIPGNDIAQVNIPYTFFWYDEFTYYELAARGYTLKNPNGHPWLEKLSTVIKIYLD